MGILDFGLKSKLVLSVLFDRGIASYTLHGDNLRASIRAMLDGSRSNTLANKLSLNPKSKTCTERSRSVQNPKSLVDLKLPNISLKLPCKFEQILEGDLNVIGAGGGFVGDGGDSIDTLCYLGRIL
jgi:hypothetical protein